MALSFNATSNSGYQAASASYNWTHTVGTGNSQILVVSVGLLSVTNSVTAVTYNGVSLTKLRSDVSVSTTIRTEIWYLVAPATGAHSVAVTLNTASVSGASASSYNDVDPNSPVDAQNGGTGTTGAGGGSASVSTTTVTAGAWIVDAATTPTTFTVGAGQTQRANINGAVGSVGQSDKSVASPGATTMQWDNIAALTSWTMSTIALKPVNEVNVSDSSTTSDQLPSYYSDQIDAMESQKLLSIAMPNISDLTTTSESSNVLIPILNINVSDSTTTSESSTVLIPILNISVNDTTSIAQSNIELVTKFIAVADALNVDEFVDVQTYEMVVKDTVNIANIIIQNSFEMCSAGFNTNGLLDSYVEVPGVATRLNTDSFDGTVNYYFEADIFNSLNNGGTAYARLYNHTDGVPVSGSIVTAGFNNSETVRVRSGSLSLSGDKIYTVQLRNDTGNTVNTVIYGARIIVTQSGIITKTEIHQTLSSEETISSTSNTNLLVKAGQFLYNASDYDGSVTVRYDALIKANSGQSASSSLYDNTAGGVIAGSVVTTSNTTYTLVSSGSITLNDGDVHIPTAYISGGSAANVNFEGAHIVFTITNFTKFLQYLEVSNQGSGSYSTTSTSYSSSIGAADSRPAYSQTDFLNSNITYYYEAVLNPANSAQTAFSQLATYDNLSQTVTAVSGTEVSVTGTTSRTRERSNSFTIPADAYTYPDGVIGNEYGFQFKTSNSSSSTNLVKAYLILAIINIGANKGEFINLTLVDDVNKSDAITTSESQTVFLPHLAVNVSDSTTTSENLPLFIEIKPNVNDIVNTSESLNFLVDENIVITDNSTTSEYFTFFPIIVVTDTVSTDEFIDTTEAYQIDVSDTIDTNEAIVLQVVSFFIPFYELNTAPDNISTSENTQVVTSSNLYTINLSDTVSVSEFSFVPTTAQFVEVIYISMSLHTATYLPMNIPSTNIINLVVK